MVKLSGCTLSPSYTIPHRQSHSSCSCSHSYYCCWPYCSPFLAIFLPSSSKNIMHFYHRYQHLEGLEDLPALFKLYFINRHRLLVVDPLALVLLLVINETVDVSEALHHLILNLQNYYRYRVFNSCSYVAWW